ncbi:MAG TPA: hypothetical protein VFX98_04855 [Longimicrobiaceae bacterium]|nr:hypothetical protein [Longimicrobiaceae bacterium]
MARVLPLRTQARLPGGAALLLLLAACGGDATAPDDDGPERHLYVDAAAGSDARDGRTPADAFRTVGRALAEIPDAPGARWTVHLRPGRYLETVRLERFLMPTAIGLFQFQTGAPPVSLTLLGDTTAPGAVVLAPPDSSRACLVAASVVLFVRAVACEAPAYGGFLAAGSSLVLDDVLVQARDSTDIGVYLDRTTAYAGGRLTVRGRMGMGLAVRNYSLFRSGSLRNRLRLTAVFEGGVATGIFLRDNGGVTTAFGIDTFRFDGTRTAILAQGASHAFFTNTVSVEGRNLATAFHAVSGSGVNAHEVTMRGVSDALVRCRNQSYVVLETGTFEGIARVADADASCQVRAGALTGG